MTGATGRLLRGRRSGPTATAKGGCHGGHAVSWRRRVAAEAFIFSPIRVKEGRLYGRADA